MRFLIPFLLAIGVCAVLHGARADFGDDPGANTATSTWTTGIPSLTLTTTVMTGNTRNATFDFRVINATIAPILWIAGFDTLPTTGLVNSSGVDTSLFGTCTTFTNRYTNSSTFENAFVNQWPAAEDLGGKQLWHSFSTVSTNEGATQDFLAQFSGSLSTLFNCLDKDGASVWTKTTETTDTYTYTAMAKVYRVEPVNINDDTQGYTLTQYSQAILFSFPRNVSVSGAVSSLERMRARVDGARARFVSASERYLDLTITTWVQYNGTQYYGLKRNGQSAGDTATATVSMVNDNDAITSFTDGRACVWLTDDNDDGVAECRQQFTITYQIISASGNLADELAGSYFPLFDVVPCTGQDMTTCNGVSSASDTVTITLDANAIAVDQEITIQLPISLIPCTPPCNAAGDMRIKRAYYSDDIYIGASLQFLADQFELDVEAAKVCFKPTRAETLAMITGDGVEYDSPMTAGCFDPSFDATNSASLIADGAVVVSDFNTVDAEGMMAFGDLHPNSRIFTFKAAPLARLGEHNAYVVTVIYKVIEIAASSEPRFLYATVAAGNVYKSRHTPTPYALFSADEPQAIGALTGLEFTSETDPALAPASQPDQKQYEYSTPIWVPLTVLGVCFAVVMAIVVVLKCCSSPAAGAKYTRRRDEDY